MPSTSPTTRPRDPLCSLASCIHLKLMGLEPILQMVVPGPQPHRPSERYPGRGLFDIHNILCLSGIIRALETAPGARMCMTLTPCSLIQTVRHMRDEGKFLGGDDIKRPPDMFVGAAANPFADPFEIRVPRLAKKIAAGVEFIQTQCILIWRSSRTVDETGPGPGLMKRPISWQG
jgi:methylenetetrahydrofolate reductase (NADPH)